jgi:hypothetical protein
MIKDSIINIPITKEPTWMMRMMVTTAQVIMEMRTEMKMSKLFTFLQPQLDLNVEKVLKFGYSIFDSDQVLNILTR